MNDSIATLALDVDTRKLLEGQRAQDNFARSSQDMEMRATGAAKAITRAMIPLASAIGAALSVRALVNYTNTWSDLQSRVGLAIRDLDAAPEVLNRISGMARRTYSDLNQTAEAFLNNATQLREMGLSTSQSLDFVESLNNALVVSGAKAQQAESANRALSNAMALGQLSGDNLNTILTSGGRITELLAESLGTTTLGLRAMASEGKITSDVIINTMLSSLEMLREEADAMPATIGDAFVLIGNAALTTVGKFDQLTGASSMVAGVLISIADNMESATGYIIAGGIALAASYTPAVVAATFQTGVWIASLITLRGALLATGIGAFVVLAGMLINEFIKLVEKAGGFGAALGLMADVGVEVWDRMKTGAASLGSSLGAVFAEIRAAFLGLMADLTNRYAMFLSNAAAGVSAIPGAGGIADSLSAAAGGMSTRSIDAGSAASFAESQARRMRAAAQAGAADFSAPLASVQALRDAMNETTDEITSTDGLISAVNGVSTAATGTGTAAKTAAAETAKAVQEMESAYMGLARDGVGRAVDWMVNGFKGGMSEIRNIFMDTLRQMIATAARNRIMISLGMGGGGGAGGMASAATSMFSGAGGAAAGGGTMAALGSAFMGGASFFTSGVSAGFAAGGIGGAISGGASALATAASGASLGLGGAAAALGAVALPLAAVAATVMFFRKKTTELDNGVKVAIKGMDTAVETFRRTETSRFFGLSRRTSTSSRNDPHNPLHGAVSDIQTAIADAANVLGYGSTIFDQFTFDFRMSLKGMTEDQKLQAINAQLATMGDEFARLVPGMENMNQVLDAANQAVAEAGQLGRTRFESEMLMAARRRGEFTVDTAGPGGTNTESLIRLRKIEEVEAKVAENTAKSNETLGFLLRIFQRFEIDGIPRGPIVE